MEDRTLIIFNAISKFVKELDEHFGSKQKSLQLYSRLISKTTIIHDEPIQKHINAFQKFCVNNRNAIKQTNPNLIEDQNITYSDRVYINMHNVFKNADKDSQHTIWKYILNLSALLDPSNRAKDILKTKISSENGESKNEDNFLSNIMNQVEDQVDPTNMSNPMEAVSSIMSSGLFSNLVGGMNDGLQNGELDLGKLMGSVQKMIGNLSEMTKDLPKDPNTPDISGMVGQMTNMMSELTSNIDTEPTIKEVNSTTDENVTTEVKLTTEENVTTEVKLTTEENVTTDENVD